MICCATADCEPLQEAGKTSLHVLSSFVSLLTLDFVSVVVYAKGAWLQLIT